MTRVFSKTALLTVTILMSLFVFSGCEKDDKETNPEELITSIVIKFVDTSNAANTVTASFRDLDGEGGADPVQFDTIKLATNKTYHATIVLLNETEEPADTISNEVYDERNDHMFFFHGHDVNLVVNYRDVDDNNIPVGLLTRWITGAASSGEAHVTLKHQPGVKNGTSTPGETDIEVEFPIRIQ